MCFLCGGQRRVHDGTHSAAWVEPDIPWMRTSAIPVTVPGAPEVEINMPCMEGAIQSPCPLCPLHRANVSPNFVYIAGNGSLTQAG